MRNVDSSSDGCRSFRVHVAGVPRILQSGMSFRLIRDRLNGLARLEQN